MLPGRGMAVARSGLSVTALLEASPGVKCSRGLRGSLRDHCSCGSAAQAQRGDDNETGDAAGKPSAAERHYRKARTILIRVHGWAFAVGPPPSFHRSSTVTGSARRLFRVLAL